MKSTFLTTRLSSKSILVIVVALVAALGLLYGGKIGYDRLTNQPKSPAAVKREIFAFLKEKSGERDFGLDLKKAVSEELPSVEKELSALQEQIPPLQTNVANLQSQLRTNRQELNAADQELRKLKSSAGLVATNTNRGGARAGATNVTFDLAAASLTNDTYKGILEKQNAFNALQAKVNDLQGRWNSSDKTLNSRQQTLAVLDREYKGLQNGNSELTLARRWRQQVQEAPSWQLIFKAVGQELWLADKMLSSTNVDLRQGGLQLADQAHVDAYNTAENSWLACRIIEGYIWPNIDVAVAQSTNGAAIDQLLTRTGNTFQRFGETNNYIRNIELLIAHNPNPDGADAARFKLSGELEKMGNYEAAMKPLRAIQSSNNVAKAAKQITGIETKLKNQKKKK